MKSALVMLVLAASNATACALQFEEGWIPPSPPAAPMAAGYGKLRNTGKAVLTVTAASSPAFGSVEMHETTLVGDTSRMRRLEAVMVPAQAEVVFAPGGKHLMLMRPAETLAATSRSSVKVAFTVVGCDSPVEATLQLRDSAGEAAHDHSHHH